MRPEGTKKTKTAAADKQLIHDLVSTATEGSKQKQNDCMDKVATSITVMSKGNAFLRQSVLLLLFCEHFAYSLVCLIEVLADSVQVQNAQLKSQNDMKLMEGLSPLTKTAMSKRMAQIRMAEMQVELDTYKKNHGKQKDANSRSDEVIILSEQDQTSTLSGDEEGEGAIHFMDLMTMSQSQLKNPDGCTMLMSTQEYERRCGIRQSDDSNE